MVLQFVSSDCPLSGGASPVLGGASLGLREAKSVPAGVPWPVQCVSAPLLGMEQASHHETWLCGTAARNSGHSEGIHWCRCGEVLYGVIELAESGWPGNAGVSALEAVSEAAYTRIFRLLDEQGVPHLWRAWNYLPDIHGTDAGLERYRRFNIGRGNAFERAARSVVGRVPAACALGLVQGPVSVAFMAGTAPALPIENPRQVSAFHYPVEHGPRSPTFSRAALVYPPGQEWLFISGTASIVGHHSVHEGDVVAQSRETLDNIAAVVTEANRASRLGGYTLVGLGYRVYVRHAEDFESVRHEVRQRCGHAPAVYVQADICRSELLVEIEALACHSF